MPLVLPVRGEMGWLWTPGSTNNVLIWKIKSIYGTTVLGLADHHNNSYANNSYAN